jgi:hypothetical protein
MMRLIIILLAGTILLSKGKPVSGSNSFPVIGELNLVTAGDKTRIDGTCVRLGPGLQWVQIDLGAPAALQAIHRGRESRPAELHPGKSALAAITETMKHRATCRLVAILSPRLSDV